jgi:hypothetical protein
MDRGLPIKDWHQLIDIFGKVFGKDGARAGQRIDGIGDDDGARCGGMDSEIVIKTLELAGVEGIDHHIALVQQAVDEALIDLA